MPPHWHANMTRSVMFGVRIENMSRPQRLIELLATLQSRRRATAEELAQELGVSVRTVLRDVQALIGAGIPVFTGRGKYGGISLLPGDQVDLAKLTTPEADVLRTVGLDVDRARQLGAEAAARSALGKLVPRRPPPKASAGLPLTLSDVVTIDNRAWFSAPDDLASLARLAEDLRRGRRLRVRYRRSGKRHGAVERRGSVWSPATRGSLVPDSRCRCSPPDVRALAPGRLGGTGPAAASPERCGSFRRGRGIEPGTGITSLGDRHCAARRRPRSTSLAGSSAPGSCRSATPTGTPA